MREGPFDLPWFWNAVLGILGVTAAALIVAFLVGNSVTQSSAAADAAKYTPPPLPTSTATTASGKLAAFVGDSYTQGRGASSEGKRWINIVSAEEGWRVSNLGRGGTGYQTTADVNGCGLSFCPNYQTMAKTAVAAKADVVVIAGGQNDFGLEEQDPSKEAAAIAATFKTVRNGLPRAEIVAVGPSAPGAVTSVVRGLDSAVRAAAKSVDAKYVSLIDPDVIKPSYLLSDKAHVDDDGHKAIADHVIAGL